VSKKPSRIEPAPSLLSNVTALPFCPPLMVVTAGPFSLRTVTALPRKSTFSFQIPGRTMTMSPPAAPTTAAWIVG